MSIASKYGYVPQPEAIARSLEVIAGGLEEVASNQLYKFCFGIMDQTTLANDDTPQSVARLVEKVNSFAQDYPSWPLPASICVYPNFASVVASKRATPEVHVTTVAGKESGASGIKKPQKLVLAEKSPYFWDEIRRMSVSSHRILGLNLTPWTLL